VCLLAVLGQGSCQQTNSTPAPSQPTNRPTKHPRTHSYELLLPKRTSLRHRVPQADEGFLDFLSYLLTPEPGARPSAEEALRHPWLRHPYPPIEPMQD
jgi:serine/threonine protein kinase